MRVRVAQSGSNSVNKSSRRRDKSVEEKELLTEFVVSLEKKERKEECRGKWNTTHSFIGSSRPSHCREAARTHKTWSDWHKSDLYIFGKLLKVSHSQSITHSHARTHAHACIHFYFLALVLLPHPRLRLFCLATHSTAFYFAVNVVLSLPGRPLLPLPLPPPLDIGMRAFTF